MARSGGDVAEQGCRARAGAVAALRCRARQACGRVHGLTVCTVPESRAGARRRGSIGATNFHGAAARNRASIIRAGLYAAGACCVAALARSRASLLAANAAAQAGLALLGLAVRGDGAARPERQATAAPPGTLKAAALDAQRIFSKRDAGAESITTFAQSRASFAAANAVDAVVAGALAVFPAELTVDQQTGAAELSSSGQTNALSVGRAHAVAGAAVRAAEPLRGNRSRPSRSDSAAPLG
jgi:hypothetical protein